MTRLIKLLMILVTRSIRKELCVCCLVVFILFFSFGVDVEDIYIFQWIIWVNTFAIFFGEQIDI